jgi:hypothetical protein
MGISAVAVHKPFVVASGHAVDGIGYGAQAQHHPPVGHQATAGAIVRRRRRPRGSGRRRSAAARLATRSPFRSQPRQPQRRYAARPSATTSRSRPATPAGQRRCWVPSSVRPRGPAAPSTRRRPDRGRRRCRHRAGRPDTGWSPTRSARPGREIASGGTAAPPAGSRWARPMGLRPTRLPLLRSATATAGRLAARKMGGAGAPPIFRPGRPGLVGW